MRIEKSEILGIPIFHKKIFSDNRGFLAVPFEEQSFFLETNQKIIQINHSRSKKNVLRGLHYQYPFSQGKIIYITKGSVLDVVADIRIGSPTFGLYETFLLKEKDNKSIYVPPGFAHGFLALSHNVDFLYFITHEKYHPETEHALIWNDPNLKIKWNIRSQDVIISSKDLQGKTLRDLETQNKLPRY